MLDASKRPVNGRGRNREPPPAAPLYRALRLRGKLARGIRQRTSSLHARDKRANLLQDVGFERVCYAITPCTEPWGVGLGSAAAAPFIAIGAAFSSGASTRDAAPRASEAGGVGVKEAGASAAPMRCVYTRGAARETEMADIGTRVLWRMPATTRRVYAKGSHRRVLGANRWVQLPQAVVAQTGLARGRAALAGARVRTRRTHGQTLDAQRVGHVSDDIETLFCRAQSARLGRATHQAKPVLCLWRSVFARWR